MKKASKETWNVLEKLFELLFLSILCQNPKTSSSLFMFTFQTLKIAVYDTEYDQECECDTSPVKCQFLCPETSDSVSDLQNKAVYVGTLNFSCKRTKKYVKSIHVVAR